MSKLGVELIFDEVPSLGQPSSAKLLTLCESEALSGLFRSDIAGQDGLRALPAAEVRKVAQRSRFQLAGELAAQ